VSSKAIFLFTDDRST